MPKIINNLEERIISETEQLLAKGNKAVLDMRSIAESCGVAVGTVYNYFPSKGALFSRIFKKQWEKTFEKLRSITDSTNGRKEKMERLIETLYTDIESRHAFMRANVELMRDLHNEVIEDFQTHDKALLSVAKELEKIIDRLGGGGDPSGRTAVTLLESIRAFIRFFPDSREKNIAYLVRLLRKEIEQ